MEIEPQDELRIEIGYFVASAMKLCNRLLRRRVKVPRMLAKVVVLTFRTKARPYFATAFRRALNAR